MRIPTIKLLAAAAAVCLVIAACAPAAGRATLTYQAEPRDIVSAIVRRAPTMTPPDGYNHFSIETISDTGVTLRADPLTVVGVVGFVTGVPTETARVTVTTFDDGTDTVVAISVVPGRLEGVYDAIVAMLDDAFGRTLALPGGGSIDVP